MLNILRVLVTSSLLAFSTMQVLADQAKCEEEARAAMTQVFHPVAMRQNVRMEMGKTVIKNTVHSTPNKRSLTMNEQGIAVSLFDDGKFYTSTDGGKSWKLLSESTAEQKQAYLDGLQTQAEEATGIVCAYNVDLNGKTVNRYSINYALYTTGMKMKGTYWLDAETGFPWKVETISPHNTIIQNNEPDPTITVSAPTD